MKKILLLCILLAIPSGAFAELEFFLTSNNAPFDASVWTSDSYPDAGAGFIAIEFQHTVPPVPNEFVVVDTLVQEIFTTITSQSGSVRYEETETQQFETNYYETLISTESPQFIDYVTTSINPETETIIQEKIENNIVLTPFEETFYNCNISLSEREAIVLDVLERIDSGEIENLENISYSNPKFGDCIIPFPDVTHRESIIEESFSSNQLLAQTILGEQMEYEVHESIENLIVQETQYQESVVTSDILFSQFLESNVINASQYNLLQEIQQQYQKIVSSSNIDIDYTSIISQEYKEISDAMLYHMRQGEQGNISQSEFDIYMLEVEKFLELQKYFSHLLASGEIDIQEYNESIKTALKHMQNQKDITQRFIKDEINNEEFEENISNMRASFQEYYLDQSDNFLESYDYNTGKYYVLIILCLGVLLCITVIILKLVYNMRKKKTNILVGEK